MVKLLNSLKNEYYRRESFSDFHLTLFLQHKSRLSHYANNDHVTLIEISLDSPVDIQAAGVDRLAYTNVISDEIMVRSDINYTTLRLPWLMTEESNTKLPIKMNPILVYLVHAKV